MPSLASPLPRKRTEIVAWPAGDGGGYVVRNRRTGEAFQLGREEHFLLAQLDGRLSADQLCAAFADRFGEPLLGEELEQFLLLAEERGLLQSAGGAPVQDSGGDGEQRGSPAVAEDATAPRAKTAAARLPALPLRIATRLLSAVAAALQWAAALLNRLAARIHMFRLFRMDFVPRESDVFIVTYPRSGTTWMQMILYQLTSDGGMEIPHIAEYCPWFEKSLRSGRGFETRPSPRIFKSHLPYRQIPKGACRYIYVARDGRDSAVSNYHLCRMYTGFEGTFADYFDRFLRGKVECGSWFEHVKGWWRHRHDENVLFLTYEELTRDLEGCIRRIAAFCGYDVSPEALPGIVERCRFEFMKQHETRFDPAMELLWEQGVQLNAFIRNGKVGEGALKLTSGQRERFEQALDRAWKPAGMSWPLKNAADG